MDRMQNSHLSQCPSSPFFPTRAERVELARRRYFEEGVAPSGVVSDAVFQSWARCQRLHADPGGDVVFQPVTASRTHLSLQKNRQLRNAWLDEVPALQSMLGTTSCTAMLTDATGVLIGASCAGRAHERLMPVATRLGVDLSEDAVGTTAPGVVARTGQPVCVLGAEHYFDDVKAMNCAAAPIRDIQGRVAGVLDISSEAVSFSFDAASLVGLLASAIENRLLVAQSSEHLVVSLQVAASLLDSPFVGLVGVDSSGRVAWCNGLAARLLGLGPAQISSELPSADVTLGAGTASLASLPSSGAAAMKLPSGLTVYARSSMRAPDGNRHLVNLQLRAASSTEELPCAAEPTPDSMQPAQPVQHSAETECRAEIEVPCTRRVAEHEPQASEREGVAALGAPSLRDCDRDLIKRTLMECGGNVSHAAKTLRVSRGLIYRRLRGLPMSSAQ
jgi:sigma-54 dependent transcriptional regulator, acetoin dehydrogenase operon transcriptional activator AcoR